MGATTESGHTIILSDLHIDTWTDRPIGQTGKPKHEHFSSFLEWCEEKQIRELILNGDLMDFPPYHGHFTFPEGPCIARDVLARLVDFATRVPVTYVYGNHDIGISGFRCLGAHNLPVLKHINLCYPRYVLDDYPDTTILIEHGHFGDPFRWKYAWDIIRMLYRSQHFDEVQYSMQRRSTKTPASPDPGILTPITIQPGETAYKAILRDQASVDSKQGLGAVMVGWLKNLGIQIFVKDHWHVKATRQLDLYRRDRLCSDLPCKKRLYQVYGHTHKADIREDEKRGDVKYLYINAGTWTGKEDTGWYLDVDNEGKIWVQDGIHETLEDRRPR